VHLAIARAGLALEKSKNRLHVLTEYSSRQRINELTSAVERAVSDQLAKGAARELQQSKEEKLERQIAACGIVAPTDGTVVYADFVLEGAKVSDGQLILRVVPNAGDAPR
jgi:hypothetical protein